MPNFEKQGFGEPVLIKLNRTQIQQMREMIENFKDQDEFELKCADGKITFNFTFDLKK